MSIGINPVGGGKELTTKPSPDKKPEEQKGQASAEAKDKRPVAPEKDSAIARATSSQPAEAKAADSKPADAKATDSKPDPKVASAQIERRNLQFEESDDGDVIVKIVNPETNEIIKRIPDEKLQDVMREVRAQNGANGGFIDTQV